MFDGFIIEGYLEKYKLLEEDDTKSFCHTPWSGEVKTNGYG